MESLRSKMKFPEKLWTIVNECTSGSIGWGISGDTIILDYSKFQDEYLSKENGVFKTSNMASFIRQLNLYGFRKCNRHGEEFHEFKNPLFVKNHRDLIVHIKRKYSENFLLNSSLRTPRKPKKVQGKEEQPESLEQYARQLLKYPLLETQNAIENRPGNYLWNSLPFSPFPSNIFASRNIVPPGWLPADAAYYNSLSQTSSNPKLDNANDDEDSSKDEKQDTPKEDPSVTTNGGNGANMFFLMMPGYLPHQNHNFYSNNDFYNGLQQLSGFPFAFPNEKTTCESYSRRMFMDEPDSSNAE